MIASLKNLEIDLKKASLKNKQNSDYTFFYNFYHIKIDFSKNNRFLTSLGSKGL